MRGGELGARQKQDKNEFVFKCLFLRFLFLGHTNVLFSKKLHQLKY